MSELNVSKVTNNGIEGHTTPKREARKNQEQVAIINLVDLYNETKGDKTEFSKKFEEKNYNYNDMTADDIYTGQIRQMDSDGSGKITTDEQQTYLENKKQEIDKEVADFQTKNNISQEDFENVADMSAKEQLAYFEKKCGDKPTAVKLQAEFNRLVHVSRENTDSLVAVDVIKDMETLHSQGKTLKDVKDQVESNSKTLHKMKLEEKMERWQKSLQEYTGSKDSEEYKQAVQEFNKLKNEVQAEQKDEGKATLDEEETPL